jgi:hypothetical protein
MSVKYNRKEILQLLLAMGAIPDKVDSVSSFLPFLSRIVYILCRLERENVLAPSGRERQSRVRGASAREEQH